MKMKIPCKGGSPNLINIDQLPIRKQLIKLILVDHCTEDNATMAQEPRTNSNLKKEIVSIFMLNRFSATKMTKWGRTVLHCCSPIREHASR